MVKALRVHDRLRWVAWGTVLLTLPVTSFPFFPSVLNLPDAIVRPLALYPLAILVLLDLIPYIIRGGRLPRVILPLLAFVAVALIATEISFLNPSIPLRSQTTFSRAVRAFGTLAIGLAFYLLTVRMIVDRSSLLATLRLLCMGAFISVIWGLLQASRLLLNWPYYTWLNTIQRWFSIREMHLYRVAGLAYEPSWFADQLVVLVLPLLWAALLIGYRLFGQRRWSRLLEAGFFGATVAVLGLTYSRGGILAFGLIGGSMGLLMALYRRRTIAAWYVGRDQPECTQAVQLRLAMIRIGLSVLSVVAVVRVARNVLSRSYYFALIWLRLDRLIDLGNYLIAIGGGPRLALTEAAWRIFLDSPLLGVGLGQSGFYIFDHLPNWIYDSRSEITLMLAPDSWLFPNPKNLWVRLLAETGIIGTFLFAVFLALILLAALSMLRTKKPLGRFVGLFGLMSWMAILLEGFSLDSFALPTIWVALGITTGTARFLLKEPER